jgi:hypothetical protein
VTWTEINSFAFSGLVPVLYGGLVAADRMVAGPNTPLMPLHARLCQPQVRRPAFKRGDANADGQVDIGDGIFILYFLFLVETAPPCMDSADTNDSGAMGIGDAIGLLGHLFGNAGALPAPFGGCGLDPTPDEQGCEAYEPCVSEP